MIQARAFTVDFAAAAATYYYARTPYGRDT
jgi:hypothetical protein